jgi:hypothetical protein
MSGEGCETEPTRRNVQKADSVPVVTESQHVPLIEGLASFQIVLARKASHVL